MWRGEKETAEEEGTSERETGSTHKAAAAAAKTLQREKLLQPPFWLLTGNGKKKLKGYDSRAERTLASSAF